MSGRGSADAGVPASSVIFVSLLRLGGGVAVKGRKP